MQKNLLILRINIGIGNQRRMVSQEWTFQHWYHVGGNGETGKRAQSQSEKMWLYPGTWH